MMNVTSATGTDIRNEIDGKRTDHNIIGLDLFGVKMLDLAFDINSLFTEPFPGSLMP